jgi:polyvinyl alcohol dehydrogenase (cytochrome)
VSGYCPQAAAGTALDFDHGASPNLFTTSHGRKLIGIGQKGGWYRVLDATTGTPVWTRQLAQPAYGTEDPGRPGIEWGTSWDGKRIYAATWVGPNPTLTALDPDTGATLWQQPHPADGCTTGGAAAFPAQCSLGYIQALSTTPGLVYTGSSDGKIRVYGSDAGKLLWQYDTVRSFTGVNGLTGQGDGVSGNGGPVISHGLLYVQSGYYPYYSTTGTKNVLLAFGP